MAKDVLMTRRHFLVDKLSQTQGRSGPGHRFTSFRDQNTSFAPN